MPLVFCEKSKGLVLQNKCQEKMTLGTFRKVVLLLSFSCENKLFSFYFVGVRDWRFMCNKNVRLAPNQITRGRYTQFTFGKNKSVLRLSISKNNTTHSPSFSRFLKIYPSVALSS